MGIAFLTGLLFGVVAFFAVGGYYKKNKNKNLEEEINWTAGLSGAIIGLLLGVILSISVGKKIAKKCLASQVPVIVLENIDLLPFSGNFGAYIVTGENHSKKVVWYLQEEGLFEEPYNDIIDMGIIIFSNTSVPAKQLIKVNVGNWKWFAIIPNEYRFVIPVGGLQEGMIVKNFKFIPK